MTALHLISVTSPPSSKSSTVDSNSAVHSAVQTTIISMATSKEANRAELLWAHRVVMCHQSYRSCLGLNRLFKSMLNDSQIAKKFALSKIKCAYLIKYGMAPYFKETLVESVKRSPDFAFSFDESLNSAFQEEQMDCLIRFWNDAECQLETWYLDSKFLSRPNAKNLLEKLLEALTPLGIYNLVLLFLNILFSEKHVFMFFLFQLKLVSWISPQKLDFDITTLSLLFQLSTMMSLNFKGMLQSSHFIKCNRMSTRCHVHKHC